MTRTILFAILMLLTELAYAGGSARPTSAHADRLAAAAEAYRDASGNYPAARGEALLELLRPYDANVSLVDEWGTPLRFFAMGSGYMILSGGADGQFATSDDVTLEDRNRRMMKSLGICAEAYRTDRDLYPAAKSLDEFVALVQPVYIRTAPKSDVWGTPFRYRVAESRASFEVRSAGADREFDTRDDVVVHDETRSALLSLRTAVDAYKIDHRVYPEAESVKALVGFIQPKYIMRTPTTDAWGTEIRYASADAGAAIELRSAGPDKTFGTADDIALGE